MYTQCPACGTVFSVSAEQLDAAGGRVRCGACRAAFDALLYLVERLPDAQSAASVSGSRTADDGTARPQPAGSPARGAAGDASPPARDPTAVLAPGKDIEPSHRTRQAYGSAVVPPAAVGPGEPSRGADPGAPAGDTPRMESRVPDALRADLGLARRDRLPWPVRALQIPLALALVGLLAAQVAWLVPVDLLGRAPFLRPWLERMAPTFDAASAALGWDRPAPRDPGRIRVRDRDIREHPEHRGALLVRATLVNEASFPQPPPRVRLTLFDVNGAVLAQRVFLPSEYLEPAGAVPVAGAGIPWQLRLDVVAPPAPAVSYQIDLI